MRRSSINKREVGCYSALHSKLLLTYHPFSGKFRFQLKMKVVATLVILAAFVAWSAAAGKDCPAAQGYACPAVYQPVCGSDGATYGNSCELSIAQMCNPRKNPWLFIFTVEPKNSENTWFLSIRAEGGSIIFQVACSCQIRTTTFKRFKILLFFV